MKQKVKIADSYGRRFRFGGDKVLTSSKVIRFPAREAGKNVTFESHVVNSGISLLWSLAIYGKGGSNIGLAAG